jgi:hypothetical protein
MTLLPSRSDLCPQKSLPDSFRHGESIQEHRLCTCNQTAGSMRSRLVPTLPVVCLLLYPEDGDDHGNRQGRAALACHEDHSI